ncbi:MAG: hypothetical protein Q9220_004497 [cf. Caloplaca sp. 1 TL-2023]
MPSSNGLDLFDLQVSELLNNSRPKYAARMTHVEEEIRRLRDVIESLPDQEILPLQDVPSKFENLHGIQIPFPEPNTLRTNLLLAFSKPTNVSIVGSYARKTAVLLDKKVDIDVAVTMPSHIFQVNDYRENRYFHKRAYYLACLAAGIQKSQKPVYSMSFAYQDDNSLQPILIIQPNPDVSAKKHAGSLHWRIRILLAAAGDLFPLNETLPTKACVQHAAADKEAISPSPIYNATLRSECCSSLSLKQLNQSLVRSPVFRDVCMLGAIWLRQRGLSSSFSGGGFGQFEWASLISVLMREDARADRPALSPGYSRYQLFKATLQFLSIHDLVSSPIVLQCSVFKRAHTNAPTLFDGSRGLNLLFKMSPWSYEMLRREAKTAVNALNDPLADIFRVLFISRVDEPGNAFDYVFSVPMSNVQDAKHRSSSTTNSTLSFASKVYEKFTYGLGERVSLVYPRIASPPAWPLIVPTTNLHGALPVTVGLLFDPEQCRKIVDRGPSIEDKTASALFREFWGEKAELRRFKDGAILESVVWNEINSQGSVIDMIITFILKRHFDQDAAGCLGVFSDVYEGLLPQPPVHGDPLSLFIPAMSAFDSLCKSIRALNGLPLQVRDIHAASPDLSFSSVYGLLVGRGETLKGPVEIRIHFEGSTRWPEDLLALQRTKIAFLAKIGDCLLQDKSILASRLGLNGSWHAFQDDSFLDINVANGAIFRLRVYHERELNMLEQALSGKVPTAASREEISLAVAEHKRRFLRCPSHTQAVSTLCTRFPLLSPTIRLCKRWRASHLLSPHIRDELIELIAIRTFVCPYPWQQPGSLKAAFLRTLTFIAGWNWRLEPMIVKWNADMSEQEIDAIRVRFEAWRRLDPSMNRVALFAASNIDHEGITWTDHRPTKMIAARFTTLAKAACKLEKAQGWSLRPEALFNSSLGDFDFLIHLNMKNQKGGGKNSSFKNLRQASETEQLGEAYNPRLLFCRELENLHDDNAILFWNEYNLTLIAGLWNPQTGPRKWKTSLDYSTQPMLNSEDAEPRVTINKTSILHGIARLGGDLVTRIDQNQRDYKTG